MDGVLYNDGSTLFSDGEMIYINLAVEQMQSHRHAHDFIEIAYVAAGKGIHRIGDREYRVKQGDLFVINFDIVHEFLPDPADGTGGLMVYNCVFRPQFLDRSLINSRCFSDITHVFLLNSLSLQDTGGDLRILNRDMPEIREIYERMYREYHAREYGYIEMLRGLLLELLVLIFRTCRGGGDVREDSHEKRLFDDTIRFMKEHYKEEIKLEDLAAISFLSRSYFCAKFKECTGQTVLEYIQGLRIREACSLLRESDKKIVDIAEAVGYRDQKFFNRLFRSVTGMTPREYRKIQKAGG